MIAVIGEDVVAKTTWSPARASPEFQKAPVPVVEFEWVPIAWMLSLSLGRPIVARAPVLFQATVVDRSLQRRNVCFPLDFASFLSYDTCVKQSRSRKVKILSRLLNSLRRRI